MDLVSHGAPAPGPCGGSPEVAPPGHGVDRRSGSQRPAYLEVAARAKDPATRGGGDDPVGWALALTVANDAPSFSCQVSPQRGSALPELAWYNGDVTSVLVSETTAMPSPFPGMDPFLEH